MRFLGSLIVTVTAIGTAMLGLNQVSAQTQPAAATAPIPAAAQRPPLLFAWVTKKDPYEAYTAPNKPIWKLSDVLAMHKGQQNWIQPIFRNKDLAGDWHQLAAGGTAPELMYPDNRVGLIVWGGQLKVSIEGQQPFVASKGFEIDVPFRVAFTLETVGSEPALWFEIHQANDTPIYPVTSHPDKPRDIPGYKYTKVVVSGGPGVWDEANKPYLDYNKDVINGSTRATAFIASDHMFVNNIRGKGVPTPPATNLGHFHVDFTESWFIMEGNVDYQIEGVPFFTASAGDIVTAAMGRWHRASFGGPIGQMDSRVAINPFPRGLHDYSEESGGRQ